MNQFIHELTEAFTRSRNCEIAKLQSAYMKNKFIFFGIKKTQRSVLEKEITQRYQVTSTDELHHILLFLWQLNEREFQYTALSLAKKYHKLWIPESLMIFEQLIRSKSWWDTVDDIASNLVGKLLCKYPELRHQLGLWINDPDIWIRRSAIIYQLTWKKNTDYERLFRYCKARAHEKEFFIRKAIGWALRAYSKHNPDAVRKFIQQHGEYLSPLSLREAKKYI